MFVRFLLYGAMEVQLTADQKAFIRHAIQSGRFHREEQAVEEALSLGREREGRRVVLVARDDDARHSVERGEGLFVSEETMRGVAEVALQRGGARYAAELLS